MATITWVYLGPGRDVGIMNPPLCELTRNVYLVFFWSVITWAAAAAAAGDDYGIVDKGGAAGRKEGDLERLPKHLSIEKFEGHQLTKQLDGWTSGAREHL